jgi:hypothetical protein
MIHPNFTHAEIMMLLDAVASHIENHDDENVPAAAESASDKLNAYVAALAGECCDDPTPGEHAERRYCEACDSDLPVVAKDWKDWQSYTNDRRQRPL